IIDFCAYEYYVFGTASQTLNTINLTNYGGFAVYSTINNLRSINQYLSVSQIADIQIYYIFVF
ncbi:MAG: hypothetical protein OEW87_12915, partial [Flavobacteriaceae bacterium]|nr:hypothetical protein [Flavobacteriaceae bacterium]